MKWHRLALTVLLGGASLVGGCVMEVEPLDPEEEELAPATAPPIGRSVPDSRDFEVPPHQNDDPIGIRFGVAGANPEPTPWAPGEEEQDGPENRFWDGDEDESNPEPTPWEPNELSSNPEPTPWREDGVNDTDELVVAAPGHGKPW